jgi:spore coat polysaccharide biosynthesis protein SpsF (cytidylyltransferase family)
VTPYFYQHPDQFSLFNVDYPQDLSSINVSVDTQEDFEFVKKLITYFYPKNPLFELEESVQKMLIFESQMNFMGEKDHGNFSKAPTP